MDVPPGCRLTIEKDPSARERNFIDDRLGDYNEPFMRDPRFDYFDVFLRDDGDAIRAGLIGSLYGGWLFTNLLWVEAKLRGCGLFAEAKRRALAFGCHWAWIDTFSFQTPELYKKLGCREFARLDEYPPGHQRIFLKKRLVEEV